MPETADGALMLSGPPPRRSRPGGRPRPVQHTAPGNVVAAAVRALRAGDRARTSRPEGVDVARLPRTPSLDAVDALRAAAGTGRTVWMGYVDQHGGASDRIVDPVRIEGGLLTAYDHAAGESRTFALHRITGAMPVRE